MVSSPTVKGASRVETAYLNSTRQSYWVPCPECGHFQILRWPNLEWPDADPAAAAYRCEHCGALIPPYRKAWMLARGEWRPANPGSKVVGFWINQLYSPWKEWGETAAEFLEAKESPETLRTFVNTALGEPWDDEAHTSVDLATLLARRSRSRARPNRCQCGQNGQAVRTGRCSTPWEWTAARRRSAAV
jgi:phage terminase large subunit GpA-like protein